MAITQTITETFARNVCIQNQFKIAFKRIMGYSSNEYKKFLDAISLHKIDSITFWAYKKNSYGKKEKWIELILNVDWKEHNNYLIRGGKTVELKRKWNGVLPEIEVAIDDIESFIEENQLIPSLSVGFASDLSTDEYNGYMKSLGLVHGKVFPWKEDVVEIRSKENMVSLYKKSAREIPELTAELRVASKFV
ncbi:hypothetical protein B5F53_18475 [Blautia sp. An249]|uniref:hypothetical protein n=1 Tax=Blautia sp. An249 TaxID=1965603 RepID=UPI000B3B0789|nr:hypothetical protein [Blautia sp. An249]OUO75176.1 hypothetical protein B5F53_18475 [Blautia sp. An249]